MYNLAVLQYQLGQNADALKTLDRYVAETGTDPAETAPLRASMLANLDQPDQAAAVFEQAWKKNPADSKALANAVALYRQAKQDDKANALLLEAKSKGGLDAEGYRDLYVGYINDNKTKEAIAAIDEGIAKGMVKPSPDLAKAYSVIAQNAYAAGDAATAIAMYERAAPIAGDGEPSLNLARVLFNERRLPESRQAAAASAAEGRQEHRRSPEAGQQQGQIAQARPLVPICAIGISLVVPAAGNGRGSTSFGARGRRPHSSSPRMTQDLPTPDKNDDGLNWPRIAGMTFVIAGACRGIDVVAGASYAAGHGKERRGRHPGGDHRAAAAAAAPPPPPKEPPKEIKLSPTPTPPKETPLPPPPEPPVVLDNPTPMSLPPAPPAPPAPPRRRSRSGIPTTFALVSVTSLRWHRSSWR